MLEEVIKSYKTVIEDVLADDTWLPKPKEKVLSLLRTRLMELETVWSIPDELWHAEFDEVELPDPKQCNECKGLGEITELDTDCHCCKSLGSNCKCTE
jgi:hypothetical protein